MRRDVSNDASRGYAYAFLAAVCGGIIPTATKALLSSMPPAAVAAWGFLLSGLLLMPLRPVALPTKVSLRYVAFFGLLGAALGPILYSYGLSSTTAVNASLLANGEVFFTALIAFAFFGERLTRKQLGFGVLIVGGILIVSTNLELSGIQFFQGLVGNLLILTATLAWSVENNTVVNATRRFGAGLITKFRNFIGGSVVFVACATLGIKLGVGAGSWFPLGTLALSLAGTSYLAIAALGKIGAVRTILVFSTTSVFGAVFALVFLGEQITPVQLLGGATILLGVYLFQRNERKPFGRGHAGGRL